MDDATRNQTLQRLDELWHIRQPAAAGAESLASRAIYRLLGGIIEQQNAFNAAVVQAIQALAANDDRRHTELVAQIHLMNGQLNAALRRMEQIERHLADVDDAETALATALVELRHDLVARDGEPGT